MYSLKAQCLKCHKHFFFSVELDAGKYFGDGIRVVFDLFDHLHAIVPTSGYGC